MAQRGLPTWFNRIVWGTILILVGVSLILHNSFFDWSSRFFRIAVGLLILYIGLAIIFGRHGTVDHNSDLEANHEKNNEQNNDSNQN